MPRDLHLNRGAHTGRRSAFTSWRISCDTYATLAYHDGVRLEVMEAMTDTCITDRMGDYCKLSEMRRSPPIRALTNDWDDPLTSSGNPADI